MIILLSIKTLYDTIYIGLFSSIYFDYLWSFERKKSIVLSFRVLNHRSYLCNIMEFIKEKCEFDMSDVRKLNEYTRKHGYFN